MAVLFAAPRFTVRNISTWMTIANILTYHTTVPITVVKSFVIKAREEYYQLTDCVDYICKRLYSTRLRNINIWRTIINTLTYYTIVMITVVKSFVIKAREEYYQYAEC